MYVLKDPLAIYQHHSLGQKLHQTTTYLCLLEPPTVRQLRKVGTGTIHSPEVSHYIMTKILATDPTILFDCDRRSRRLAASTEAGAGLWACIWQHC